MALNTAHIKYVPGAYARKNLSAAQRVVCYSRQWHKESKKEPARPTVEHQIDKTITISRKIGVGAVEIADLVAKQIGHNVADRQVVELIANDEQLNQKAVRIFDERYPGKLVELQYHLFGDKSFSMDRYTKRLFSAIYAMAETHPTIFVGRGAHLVLPRNRTLSVRIISSPAYRIDRVANLMNVDTKSAEAVPKQHDREQKDFFKKVFNKKDAAAYEFDLVINRDFIAPPQCTAEVILAAYQCKFEE